MAAGVTAGVTAGLKATKNGGNFWSGKRPEVNSISTLTPKGIEPVGLPKPKGGDLSGLQPVDSGLLDSPTGLGIRNDAGGAGHFGASRIRNNVSIPGAHKGLDFSSVDGQNIISPIGGRVRNFIGHTSGKPMLQLRPVNSNLGFDTIEMLYVKPPKGINYSGIWRNVSAGDVIGSSVNLQSLGYAPKLGSHIHLQLKLNGNFIDPTPFFFK